MIAGKMKIPDGDSYFERQFMRSGDRFQFDVYQAALRHTQRRRFAIDVGAHVGSWTRAMASDFAEVCAFEPHPENFECLQENTRGLNVSLVGAAVGESNGQCDMAKHADNSGCWRVIHGAGVNIVSIDSFSFGHVDLLKIDVEGYEGSVVRGASKTIYEWEPVIVFEDNGLGPKFYGDAWIDPKHVLRDLGYRRRERINKDEVWAPL